MDVPRWFADLMESELRGIVSLSSEQLARLHSHYELLVKWNQRMNLTSICSPEEIVIRHYCESLFFGAEMAKAGGGGSIVDVGSGAGFPGIPVAVLHPEWRVTLVESNVRKSVFLRESSRGLTNVTVKAVRAESLAEHFDRVVSRAVKPEDVLRLLPRLAGQVGLLLGETDLASIRDSRGFRWLDPVKLPWGDHRLAVFGECFT
jgi:16S rRNA (guanine527-N7)-methyltransferase